MPTAIDNTTAEFIGMRNTEGATSSSTPLDNTGVRKSNPLSYASRTHSGNYWTNPPHKRNPRGVTPAQHRNIVNNIERSVKPVRSIQVVKRHRKGRKAKITVFSDEYSVQLALEKLRPLTRCCTHAEGLAINLKRQEANRRRHVRTTYKPQISEKGYCNASDTE